MPRFVLCVTLGTALALAFVSTSQAVDLEWDGGGGTNNWANNSNWDPPFEPASGDNVTIAGILMGGGPHTVLDADYVIASLTLQNSSEVDTINFLLAVEGHTQLSGAGTRLILRERTTGGDGDTLDTDTLSIGTGSFIEMYENSVLEVDDGLFSVFGTLVGNGTVELVDNPATATALLSIFGTLSAGQAGTFIGPPPPRTMTITAPDADARIGMSALGLIEVQENATLNNHVRMLNDNLANLRLWPNSTYQMDHSWHLVGDIDISTGPGSGTDPATIAAGQADLLLTLDSGSTVTVDADESLRFDIELLAENGSTLANSGTIIFDGPAQFGAMADLSMLGNFASLVVNAPVSIDQSAFNLDGNGGLGNTITVNAGGVLTVDVDAIDIGDNVADGTIAVNSGVLEVRTASPGWTMNGRMTLTNTAGTPAIVRNISGGLVQTLQIGDGSGVSDAELTVQGTGESIIDYRFVNFSSDADVKISAGAILNLDGVTFFLSSDATFDGAGTFKPGAMRVQDSTTLNIAVVDLDDGVSPGGTAHELRAPLIINADAISDDGDGFDGDMVIQNNLALLSGELNVQLSAGQAASWSFDSGEIRLIGPDPATAPNAAEMLDGSAIEIGTEGGTLVVEGWARSVARLDIYGTVSIVNDGDDVFVLDGGSQQNPNRFLGGDVEGAGTLHVGSNNALVGHGTIETSLQGTSDSRLVADDGTLNINGSIASFDEIEVTDDGVLDVELPWNTNDAGEVILSGGELTGATVTHDSFGGIVGYGLITASIVNNTFIRADSGETLVIEESAGASQILLDGVMGDGTLLSVSAGTLLHLRRDSPGVLRTFNGTMRTASGGQIFAENFTYRFTTGSLMRFGGGSYSSNLSVIFEGEVAVDAGTSATLSLLSPGRNARFASTSTTTLDGELVLDNNETLIESGASISGIGSLVNAENRLTMLSDGVGLAVAVINHGQLAVGNDSTDNQLGTVELNSLTQSATGELQIDLNGLGTGQFDFLMVNNNAILAGTLSVNLLGTFTPLLGNSWTILTTSLGQVDADTLILSAPVVNDLTFEMVVNSQSIVLQVIEAISLAGDYNENGVVDAADYTVWRDNLGAAAGTLPNDVDGGVIGQAQYDTWKQNFGNVAGSGSLAVTTVPEPAAAVLWILGIIAVLLRRRTK
jgi:hypothetical protein